MKQNLLPELKSIKPIWIYYLSNHKKSFIFSILYLVLILIAFTNFLQFVEQRDGYSFTDPILVLFEPVDVTWITFLLIYTALFLAIFHFLDKPQLLHTGILTYSIMVTFRIAAMYLLPLNPPETMIFLNDPFVQLFGSGEILTKDLFFSGHTSTLFMLFLVSTHKSLKLIFLIFTILVAACVLLQHVHYSVDVFVAPVFSFVAYQVAKITIK